MQTSAAVAVKPLMPIADVIQLIPVEKIDPSPRNARKEFSKEYIAELGASIARDGQQQAGKVRPLKNGRFQLIYGECRWRGAKAAGVELYKAVVEEMDDAKADRLCLIENLKRRDLTVFEEAEHLKMLHEQHKVKIDDLAVQVGISVRGVYEALKLATASEPLRQAVLEKRLPVSQAKLIARLPEKVQGECVKQAAADANNPAMPHDQLEEHIRETYMVDLRHVAFDIKQKGLSCLAATCFECPRNARNCKEEYPGLKGADVCTSPEHFRKKLTELLRAKATELGAKVVPEAEAAKMFNRWGDFIGDSAYSRADARHPRDVQNRTWKELLSKDEAKKRLALVLSPKNELVELYDNLGIEKAVKEQGKLKTSNKADRSPAEKAAEAKRSAADELRERVAPVIVGRIVEKIEAKGLPLELLRQVVDDVASDAHEDFWGRRKWDNTVPLGKMKLNELLAALWEARSYRLTVAYNGYDASLVTAAEALGVDPKKVEKEFVEAETKAKKLEAEKASGLRDAKTLRDLAKKAKKGGAR